MLRAYKYKLKPNRMQIDTLLKYFGCVRFVYNWGLTLKMESYKENGQTISYTDLAKRLTELKKDKETLWLSECPIVSLQQSLRTLENAFTGFFRKKTNYPKFKSKKHSKNVLKFIGSEHFDFENWRVKLPKIGWVNLCKNKPFDKNQCRQGTTTVSRDRCGTFWVTVVVDDMKPAQPKTKVVKETAVGIDLGIRDYAILSDGTKFPNPKYYESRLKTLARLQKRFAKTKPGSNRHEKARLNIAKCYRKITNMKNDTIHKLTTGIIKEFDNICIEDLNIEGMMKSHNLAMAIQSASWGEFIRQLNYKAEWYGKNIIKIGRFEPSSKLCHKCGYINNGLSLKDREWVCPICGEKHDRDVNAAINIKNIAFEKQNLIGL